MVETKEYTEGRITFLSADVEHYSGEKGQPTTDMPVFYNPRMSLNRDLSVLFLSAYMQEQEISMICEPLTGSGVRTIRYLKECPGNAYAVMFDANPTAIEIVQENIMRNELKDRARVVHGDAKVLLLTESREKRFDFVDIDPFGSPSPYINAGVQSLSPRGGLLALTATDMPALCGVWPQVAMRKYGGFSIRAPFSHELAVRLLLGHAYHVIGMNDQSMTPLVSLSTDHYVRVWVRTKSTRTTSNIQSSDLGIIRFCPDCLSTQRLSLEKLYGIGFAHQENRCAGKVRTAGPLWIGPLFDVKLLENAQSLLPDHREYLHRRVERILKEMHDESPFTDFPYIDLHVVCDLYNLIPPKLDDVLNVLREAGYRTTKTHFRPTAIRTDASVREVADTMRRLSEEA